MKKVWIIMVLAGLLACSTATAQETIIPYRPGCGPVDEEKVYDVVEWMPSFPGGIEALKAFLAKNLRFPKELEETCVQGRVIITFIVEKDGSLSHAKVIRSVDPALDKEALRVVKKMPKWIPGQQNDRKVRVRYIIPVTFRL